MSAEPLGFLVPRRPLLDDSFDSLARDVRRLAPVRLIWTLVFGVTLIVNVGWAVGLMWTVAGSCVVAWGHLANGPASEGTNLPAWRLNRLAALAGSSAAWTSMAVIYWFTGDVVFQLLALAVLGSFLILAQSYSFKSQPAVIAFGVLPALAFILLPIAFGGFSGFKLVSLGLGLALALLYLFLEVRQNIANARMLREAQAELREQKEVAIAANQAKSSFLAMMSHELRTPMNGVLGMAHALTLTKLDRRQASHVDMLVRSGKGLMSILNDILDISKVEAGKLELEIIAFDLHELGQRVHDLWTEAASSKGVRLVYDLAPDVPQWVSGDPTRLRQIMINLVSNALKFTSEGEVRLSIRWAGDDGCEIAVSDTGPGIPEAQQARLFESFAQADVSVTRKFGGTGLGLAICKQLVTLMEGEIQVVSREGEGSTFSFCVRLPPAEALEVCEDEETDSALTNLRILVADDNIINQAVARAILESVGAIVVAAGDGREALDRIRGEAFDVVLMDIHMPKMDGVEALQHIRADRALAQLAVIALTADAMAGVERELLAAGFDDVAPKPINPAQLVAKIMALAAHRQDGSSYEPASAAG